MLIRGLDFVTAKNSTECQTDLSFVRASRPGLSIYPPFTLPDDRELLRSAAPFKFSTVYEYENKGMTKEKKVNF